MYTCIAREILFRFIILLWCRLSVSCR